MSVDNFELIKNFLDYENDFFYHIQVIKRRKENPDMKKSTSIKGTYRISSKEDFDKLKENIVNQCKFYNARAYIYLNKRSYKKVALQMLKILAEKISSEEFNSCHRVYDHACGIVCSEDKNKKWIIDVDTKEQSSIEEVERHLKEIEVEFLIKIPTKNGYHYIVRPFDKRKLKLLIDLHKDNGTLLYF